MSELVVEPDIRIPLREFEITFARSSGPGGQNVNKVSSKATLRWPMHQSPSLSPSVRTRFLARFGSKLTTEGELLITSQRYRDQGRNVADCIEKLRVMLAEVAVAPRKRRPSKPTRAAVERRLQEKRRRASTKRERRSAPNQD